MLLKTNRLIIRKITLEDSPFYLKLFNSEGWLKYIGDRNIHTLEDAEAYIEKNYLSSYEKHGYGSYAVDLKEENTTIGACGLYKRDNLEYPDVGFAFLPEYSGKGYGYESAAAILEYAKGAWGIHKVYGFTVDYNKPSISLLKKLGLTQKGTYTFKDDPEELLLFSN
ncbi:MAG: GNAT family N-acetyltransferase [Flavobacteriaceae bacterium]|nr:GNAT family N-acetyltransferase [Flavobacteriaceae bacterium]